MGENGLHNCPVRQSPIKCYFHDRGPTGPAADRSSSVRIVTDRKGNGFLEKNVLHYFVDTNSSRGFVSFWESNFGKLEKVVKLDGYPDLLVTQLVSQACAQALGCEQEVELVHNCLDNSLQGIIHAGTKDGAAEPSRLRG